MCLGAQEEMVCGTVGSGQVVAERRVSSDKTIYRHTGSAYGRRRLRLQITSFRSGKRGNIEREGRIDEGSGSRSRPTLANTRRRSSRQQVARLFSPAYAAPPSDCRALADSSRGQDCRKECRNSGGSPRGVRNVNPYQSCLCCFERSCSHRSDTRWNGCRVAHRECWLTKGISVSLLLQITF